MIEPSRVGPLRERLRALFDEDTPELVVNVAGPWIACRHDTPLTGVDAPKRHVTDPERDAVIVVGDEAILPERRHAVDFEVRPEPEPEPLDVEGGEPRRDLPERARADDRRSRELRVVGVAAGSLPLQSDGDVEVVAQPSLDRFAIGFEVELAGIVPVLPAERDVRRARIERRAESVDGRRPLAVDVAAVLVDDGVLAVAFETPVLDDPRRVAFGGIE